MAIHTISIDNIPDGVLIVGFDGLIRAANPAALRLFGYKPGELAGQKLALLTAGRCAFETQVRVICEGDTEEQSFGKRQEITGRRKDGSEFPLDISLQAQEQAGEIICFVRDISDHVRMSDEIREIAYRDMVTGTLNRRAFYEDLARILEIPAPGGPGTGVAILDLDHFKDVNDSLGHNFGDRLLAEFCDRMRSVLHEDMRLYRIGGDEFAIIMPRSKGRNDACEFINGAIRQARLPYTIEGHSISIGCSAGIVHAPGDGDTAEELLVNADLALYDAKAERGTSSMYSPHLRDAMTDRFSLLNELRTAGAECQFQLHFQPQVDIRSGTITGAEALLRWSHPKHGLLHPSRFIDVLTDSEISVAIGRWILFEACRHAVSWQASVERPIRVAVNLFPWQVKTRKFFDDVGEALDSAGLNPSLLEVELTENTIIESSADFIEVLGAVRDMGVSIALDDFGTGFASLNSLTRFPINTIKIDRSFVRDVGAGKGNWPVLRTIPKLARDLGLTTVAEGVETAEDAMMIQHFGYDYGQGYYWGRAVDAARFGTLIGTGGAAELPDASRPFKPVRIAALDEIIKRRFPMLG